MRWIAIAIAFVVTLVVGSPSVNADDFFSSSPGNLTSSHAQWDNQGGCNSCHVDGTNAIDDKKCLNCHDHKDLGARIAQNKGFHASSTVKGKQCKTCHTEHKGRG